MNETNIVLQRAARNRHRRLCLVGAFIEFLQAWQECGFRFGDILSAIADYAHAESKKPTEQRDNWLAVATLLREAATLCETPDQELP